MRKDLSVSMRGRAYERKREKVRIYKTEYKRNIGVTSTLTTKTNNILIFCL